MTKISQSRIGLLLRSPTRDWEILVIHTSSNKVKKQGKNYLPILVASSGKLGFA